MKRGSRVKVTLEGRIVQVAPSGTRVLELDNGKRALLPVAVVGDANTFVEEIKPPAPKWSPGDVVVVRYDTSGQTYTYVRGSRDWPGDRMSAKTDEEISEMWREGRARAVLQAGGRPFSPFRIPQSASGDIRRPSPFGASVSDYELDALRRRLSR